MPYAVPQGAILEASIKGRFENQVCLSVLHYRLDQAGGSADGDGSITSFDAVFNGAGGFVDLYTSALHADYITDSVVYQWIKPTRFRRLVFVPVNGTGSIAGAKMPPNVSFAITKLGIHATRHGRGTLHMPAVPASFVIGGTVAAAGIAAYGPLANAVPVLPLGANFVPVLFNRTNYAASEQITNARFETTSRVQRRRTVGLGI